MNNKNFENEQIVEKNIVSEKLYSLFLRCSHALSRDIIRKTEYIRASGVFFQYFRKQVKWRSGICLKYYRYGLLH